MAEDTDSKTTIWQGGVIGALVGLSFAVGFYFLAIAPLMQYRSFGNLFVGLLMGSSLGIGTSGACGSTRTLTTQILGSALGGAITIFITILIWFAPFDDDSMVQLIAILGAVFGLLCSVSSGILGTVFGWACNRWGAENEYDSIISALGTSLGSAIGSLPIMFLVFGIGLI